MDLSVHGIQTYQRRNRDPISELPEDLKVKILSLLQIKCAVKTGILSKNWKNLWTKIDTIVLGYVLRGDDPSDNVELTDRLLRQFISFDHSLMQCISPTIKEFTLNCWLPDVKSMHDLVGKWLLYVLNKNVECLNLMFSGKSYLVPNFLYHSSSLVKLNLYDLGICRLPRVSWSSLKELSLSRVVAENGCIESILLGCPALITLILNEVSGLQNLNIIASSVKKLKVMPFGIENEQNPMPDKMLLIRAHWLEELEISDYLLVPFFQVADFYSLKKASLKLTTYPCYEDGEGVDELDAFNLKWIRMVAGLLNSLSVVMELIIGSEVIQALSALKLCGEPCPLLKCKCATIISPLWKYDIPGIASLLESTPNLETLIIKVSNWQEGNDCPINRVEEFFTDEDHPHLTKPSGKFMHVKNVKIDFFKSSCCESPFSDYTCFDFELVEYILKSSVVLEKLVICSSNTRCCICAKNICPPTTHCRSCLTNCSFKFVPLLSSKLITTFQVGNDSAEWELRKKKSCFEFNFSNYTSIQPVTVSHEENKVSPFLN